MALFAHGFGSYPVSDLIFPSAARTATPAVVRFGTTGACGLLVVINTTLVPGAAPSTVFTIKGNVYPAGKTPGVAPVQWTLLTSAAIVATGTVVLQVAPGCPDTANVSAGVLLPDEIEINAAHGNANSVTYSVMGILTP